MSKIGREHREAFLQRLAAWGEDIHACGETRRAVIYDDSPGFDPVFKFAEEFPIEVGDIIKRWATETNYTVNKVRPHAEAGVFESFLVTAEEHS